MTHLSQQFARRFGIMARTYARQGLEPTLQAVREDGIEAVQMNLACAGLPTLPERFEPGQAATIADTLKASGRKVVALSGTFNMIDPDLEKRNRNFQKLDLLAENCRTFGTNLITLCTGTRDPNNMWKRNPDNDTATAWNELVESMFAAVRIADRHDIDVAIEPELANVVDSAAKAKKLIDTIGSKRIKIVFDAANMIRPEQLSQMSSIIDEAFDLLRPHIAIIHAKEISASGEAGEVTPGQGVLDFARVFRHAIDAKLEVPVVMHGLPESGVSAARDYLSAQFAFAESLRTFEHDGIRFRYVDHGKGIPFVFQHGLGGDSKKIFDLTRDYPGVRLISFDARYHGNTEPHCSPDKLSFRQFAEDLSALLDHLGINQAVVGGISMGAGMALEFAVRNPNRVLGLVLARPAFLDQPFPQHVHVYAEVVSLIKAHGLSEGLKLFEQSTSYRDLLAESADAASAVTNIFKDPLTPHTLEKYDRIPHDCPPHEFSQLQGIRVPALVLSSKRDPIHPIEIGKRLASVIPGAEFSELTPKCVSSAGYEYDLNQRIGEFFEKHFVGTTNSTTPRSEPSSC